MADEPLTPEDRKNIRTLGEVHWTGALTAGNLDALVELCTDDIVYMPADHPALRGRDQFRAWLSSFPKVVKMTQPMNWIEGQGSVAMAEASFAVTLDVDGQQVDSAGKAICCLRRNTDGQWRVKSVCWNFDQPMGPPPPAPGPAA